MLIDFVQDALEAVPDVHNGEGLVFPPRPSAKKWGTRMDIRATIKTAREKAGIVMHITPHMLRHTFGTENLVRSGDIKKVQAAMRHKKLDSTLVYTKVRISDIYDMVDRTFRK